MNLTLVYIVKNDEIEHLISFIEYNPSISDSLEVLVGVIGDGKRADSNGKLPVLSRLFQPSIFERTSFEELITICSQNARHEHIVFTTIVDWKKKLFFYTNVSEKVSSQCDVYLIPYSVINYNDNGPHLHISDISSDIKSFILKNLKIITKCIQCFDIVFCKLCILSAIELLATEDLLWGALLHGKNFTTILYEYQNDQELYDVDYSVIKELYNIGLSLKHRYVENTSKLQYKSKKAGLELSKIINESVRCAYSSYLRHSQKKCAIIFTNESSATQFGIGTYISSLVACLNKNDWDIIVAKLYSSNSNECISFIGNSGCLHFGYPNDHNSSWDDICERRYDLSVFYRLASILSPRKMLCHFNIYGDGYLAELFKREFNAKIVFTVHYMSWRFNNVGRVSNITRIIQNPNSELDRLVYNKFVYERDFLLNHCDYVIAIAKHSYKLLTTLYNLPKNKVYLISNGVEKFETKSIMCERNILRKEMRILSNEKIILYVGRLEEDKGIFTLIDVFSKIYMDDDNIHLLIIGAGNYTEVLKRSQSHWKNIHIIGYVPNNQLSKYYTIADIGVVPSFHEELGYVALEMLQFDLPILVSDADGLSEIIAHTGKGYQFTYNYNFTDSNLESKLVECLKQLPENNIRKSNLIDLSRFSRLNFQKSINDLYNQITRTSDDCNYP